VAGPVGVEITLKLQTFDIRQLLTEYSKSELTDMVDFMSYPGTEPGADLAWFLESPLMMPGGVPKALSAQIATIDDPTVSAQERGARASEVVKEAPIRPTTPRSGRASTRWPPPRRCATQEAS